MARASAAFVLPNSSRRVQTAIALSKSATASAELPQRLKDAATVAEDNGKVAGELDVALLFDQTSVDGDRLVVISDRLGKPVQILKGTASVAKSQGKVPNEVLSPLVLYQPREDENGLVEISFRLAVPAQVAKGIAAVGQVHGQVNGQVGTALLLDMIGVDGDGLVILRQGLGRLAPTLLGAAAVLAATVSASCASLLPPRSGECQCPLSGSILIRPLLSTGPFDPTKRQPLWRLLIPQ